MKNNLLSLATIVAMLFKLSTINAQIQKGEIISLNKTFTEFKMSSNGNTIIAIDFPNTRSYKYFDNIWKEQKPILNKNWVQFELSKNGQSFIGSTRVNLQGDCKAFVFDSDINEWNERPGLNDSLFRETTFTQGGHKFVLSFDGKTLAILNHTNWNESKTFLKILNYQNSIWTIEFESIIENCRNPTGEFDISTKKFLLKGTSKNNKYFAKIFSKSNDLWQENIANAIEFEYFGDIYFNKDGNELNCIFNLNPIDTTEKMAYISKYNIGLGPIEKIFHQKIPELYSYSNNFSLNGKCFVTGYDPTSAFNKVRVFRYIRDSFVEISSNLISEDSTQHFGYGVFISEDCNTLALGKRTKNLILNSPSEIIVYDISNLETSSEDWEISKKFVLAPNPTIGFVKIIGLATPANISIYNTLGMLLKKIYSNDNMIDLVDLPAGIYIVNIETKTHNENHRVIKI